MADTTYRDMTEEHLGDMATSEDLKAFMAACEAYQEQTGCSDSEATEYVWHSYCCYQHTYFTKHTPGPWTIDHERIGPFGEPVALLCDMTASSPGTVVDWPRGTEVAEVADDAENEANARLLASAPFLLAALEGLLRQLENVSDYCQTCTEVRPEDGDMLHQPSCATATAYRARDKAIYAAAKEIEPIRLHEGTSEPEQERVR
tara:strand:- start:478 stop:1086 length:609 start_codon:yes stop_codon:yes gene_type:complete